MHFDDQEAEVISAYIYFEVNADGIKKITPKTKSFGEIFISSRNKDLTAPGNFLDIVHREDRESFVEILSHLQDAEEDITWRGRVNSNEGVRNIKLEFTLEDPSTPSKGWHCLAQDLTTLSRIKGDFHTLLESGRAFTWQRDLRSNIIYFGRRWTQFLHHDNGEASIPYSEWISLVHADDVESVEASIEELVNGAVEYHAIQYRRRLADGTWMWLRIHAGISARAEDGTPIALSGVSFDVTEEVEKLAEFEKEKLALQNNLADAQAALERTAYEITEHIPVGTYTMVLPPGEDFAHFGFLSKKFLELTGIDEAEVRSNPISAFSNIHPDDHDSVIRKNAYAFSRKLPLLDECRIFVDGHVRWIRAESKPRMKSDGTWVWEGVVQDITDQKASEHALSRATSNMVELERQKARSEEREALLKEIHDGFGNQLAMGKMRLRDGHITTSQAVSIMDDCLDDLRLLLSSLDDGSDSLWITLSDLEARLRKRTSDMSIEMHWEIDDAKGIQLSPRSRLHVGRIVQEAVVNAIRHSEARMVSVTVFASPEGIKIVIRDNGKGFSTEGVSPGRGLKNMLARADQNFWSLDISSGNEGTQVVLGLG